MVYSLFVVYGLVLEPDFAVKSDSKRLTDLRIRRVWAASLQLENSTVRRISTGVRIPQLKAVKRATAVCMGCCSTIQLNLQNLPTSQIRVVGVLSQICPLHS